MARIPVEDIKERAPIVDYITKHYPHMQLKMSGSIYQMLCPFHKEKSPSLAIWGNGSWKCYGCGEHGDIITFVQKIENIDFKEACQMIAENVGVNYTLEPPNAFHEAYKDKMDEHTRRYWRVLQGNPVALDYLRKERGLTDDTILKFRLGLVPQDEYKYRTDLGNIAGRLVFPIMEHKDIKSSKCLGMGYRTMKNEKPKYINDINQENKPATDKKPAQDPNLNGVFIKGNTLFAFNHAKAEIRKQNFAVVTEGYMDAISMHQSGILNSVAVMGTGFTEGQMDILIKLTANIIMFLDGDKAGITNMLRVLPRLYEKGFSVMLVIADYGMDAADVCRDNEFNQELMKAFLFKNSKPAMNVIIDRAAQEYEQIVVKERLKAMSIINPILDKLPGEAEKNIFKNLAYKRLDIAS